MLFSANERGDRFSFKVAGRGGVRFGGTGEGNSCTG